MVERHPVGSAEYVVLHAKWQASRGRRPAAAFLYERNPLRALQLARRFVYFTEDPSGLYLGGQIPPGYVCGKCGATGVKLWRPYNTFPEPQDLTCAVCSAQEEGKDIGDIDESGCHNSEMGGHTDQIGWRVPAIPTEEMDNYWGYTSVPGPGVEWWRKLPTLPKKASVA